MDNGHIEAHGLDNENQTAATGQWTMEIEKYMMSMDMDKWTMEIGQQITGMDTNKDSRDGKLTQKIDMNN